MMFPPYTERTANLLAYNMICDLADQVKMNCAVLEAAREYAQTPEGIRQIDDILEQNKEALEKAQEALQDCLDGQALSMASCTVQKTVA